MTWAVSMVPTAGVTELWPQVAPLLAPAVAASGGRITMRSTFEWLRDERARLWVAYDEAAPAPAAAFVTRVARYPARSMLAVDCAGGTDMGRWLAAVVGTFKQVAADMGLDGVELHGRPGWARALKSYGWTQYGVLCEFNIQP